MGSNSRDTFFSNPGTRLAPIHKVRIDENGHKTLVNTGEYTDTYLAIQSHVEECDITEIWARAQMEGYQVLDRREVTEGDMTVIPTSLLEAQIMLQDQENYFNQLPLETRKAFNFNFNEYIAEAGKNLESWSKKMGIVKEQPVEEPIESTTESTEKGGNE